MDAVQITAFTLHLADFHIMKPMFILNELELLPTFSIISHFSLAASQSITLKSALESFSAEYIFLLLISHKAVLLHS